MGTGNLSCSPCSGLLEDPKLHFVPWVHQNQAEFLSASCLPSGSPIGHSGTSKRRQGGWVGVPSLLCCFSVLVSSVSEDFQSPTPLPNSDYWVCETVPWVGVLTIHVSARVYTDHRERHVSVAQRLEEKAGERRSLLGFASYQPNWKPASSKAL